MNKITLYIMLFIFTSVLTSSCKQQKEEATSTTEAPTVENVVSLTPQQVKNTNITIGQIKEEMVPHTISISGVTDINANDKISVHTPYGGYLTNIKVKAGQTVVKGQVLATLENPQFVDLQQEYLTSASKIKFMEKEVERQKTLSNAQASSEKVYQQAIQDLEGYRIAKKTAEQKLRMLHIEPTLINEDNLSNKINILAPNAASVLAIEVNNGQYVSAETPLMQLLKHQATIVVMKVFEKDINQVKVGQQVALFVPSAEGTKFNCTVESISKVVNADKTIDVRCSFNEQVASKLIYGMVLQGEITTTKQNAATIEEAAVVNYEGKNYIFVEKSDKQYEMVGVEKLGKSGSRAVISSNSIDLKQAKIVVTDAYTLLMMLKNVSEE